MAFGSPPGPVNNLAFYCRDCAAHIRRPEACC